MPGPSASESGTEASSTGYGSKTASYDISTYLEPSNPTPSGRGKKRGRGKWQGPGAKRAESFVSSTPMTEEERQKEAEYVKNIGKGVFQTVTDSSNPAARGRGRGRGMQQRGRGGRGRGHYAPVMSSGMQNRYSEASDQFDQHTDAAAYGQDMYEQQAYAQEGYAQEGYAQEGYAQEGFAREGYAQGGEYETVGYDQGGYDQGGYATEEGYDQGGYDQGGYDQAGYDQGYAGVRGYPEGNWE